MAIACALPISLLCISLDDSKGPSESIVVSSWTASQDVSNLAHLQGKMTVVLDMDGTLISSFTPARAPRLPPGMLSYIVGRGARINPKVWTTDYLLLFGNCHFCIACQHARQRRLLHLMHGVWWPIRGCLWWSGQG